MKTLRPFTSTLHQTSQLYPLQCRQPFLAATTIRPTNHERQQRRTFLSNPLNTPQTLTATRLLRYPAHVIYEVISDVGAYQQFIPYCRSSVVTKTSEPASNGKKYPEEAKLTIGFGDQASEEFWSRVYCVPERVVEAVSGNAITTLLPDEIPHHHARPTSGEDPSQTNTVMSQLLTRWTLRPYPFKPPPASAVHPETTHKNHEETSEIPGQARTEVNLAIEFQFANPIYAAMSQAAAPKVADKMIEAFEKRVKAVVEGPGHHL